MRERLKVSPLEAPAGDLEGRVCGSVTPGASAVGTRMGYAGVLVAVCVYDFSLSLLENVVDLPEDELRLAFVVAGFVAGMLLMVVFWKNMTTLSWLTAFLGGYYASSAISWMGYRADYTDTPNLWLSEFLSMESKVVDCEEVFCWFCAGLWPLGTLTGVYVQLYVMELAGLDSERHSGKPGEETPLIDMSQGVPRDPVEREIYKLEKKKEQAIEMRMRERQDLKDTKKKMKELGIKIGPNEEPENTDTKSSSYGSFLNISVRVHNTLQIISSLRNFPAFRYCCGSAGLSQQLRRNCVS
ncbi:hypothetical protein CYMTET_48470 [Cymbomonas tetramitiformis]|uniref:DUF4203 domain-containing protein n=1 Tax=Cymbomonas tetramitiformis TaxID=36881 RepID=A0AAE0BTY1_9CHLO|nr:hypothetical protein CYMTET_48470 [Cymbomonas tetramitiformis]